MGPIITCFFILMIYLVIQKHCKFYGIVVIMSPGNHIYCFVGHPAAVLLHNFYILSRTEPFHLPNVKFTVPSHNQQTCYLFCVIFIFNYQRTCDFLYMEHWICNIREMLNVYCLAQLHNGRRCNGVG